MKRICVFCGSSIGNNPVFTEAAISLAGLLASRGIGLVYGGGNVGLMGVIVVSRRLRGQNSKKE